MAENTTTDYAGNYIYKNGSLKFFSHPEGYVEPDGSGGFNYIYSYLDHLGNVRMNYSDINEDGSIDPNSEILQERNYYPFGLEHQGYNSNVVSENNYQTYNGKELEKELGLEWTDYGARRYMRDLGRWTSIDPLATKYNEYSPFAYTVNNPILFVDPDGADPVNPQTGKPYKIDLWNHSPISSSINYNKSNRDHVLYNRIDRNLFGIDGFSVPRKRDSPDGTWAEGASTISRDLSSHEISDRASGIINSEFGLSNSSRVYAAGAPLDNHWKKAANSGSYSFLAPSYSENEFRVDYDNIQAIQVKDNYITGIVNLSMGESGNYEVSSVTSFSVEKGEKKTREVSSFFGLITRTEEYRELQVQETIRNFETGTIDTRSYTREEIIK